MTKLQKTSEIPIAMIVLVMNLGKILRDIFALLEWLFEVMLNQYYFKGELAS